MRLVIFLGCVIGLIFISRYFAIPAEPLQPADQAIETLSAKDDAVHVDPQVVAALCMQPIDRSEENFEPNNGIDSESGKFEPPRLDTVYLHGRPLKVLGNAKNVLPLIRAEYELPNGAVEDLLQLETRVLVEFFKNDSGHPATTKIQVTTNEKTQKAIAGFLAVLYPKEHITKLKNDYDAQETKHVAPLKPCIAEPWLSKALSDCEGCRACRRMIAE